MNNLNEDKEDRLKYAVDIPKHPLRGQIWENISYFKTKEEAIRFAKMLFGADDEGKISLVTEI